MKALAFVLGCFGGSIALVFTVFELAACGCALNPEYLPKLNAFDEAIITLGPFAMLFTLFLASFSTLFAFLLLFPRLHHHVLARVQIFFGILLAVSLLIYMLSHRLPRSVSPLELSELEWLFPGVFVAVSGWLCDRRLLIVNAIRR